ncbi:uncharacterized protein [Amphiura filiformis]|uniref:uncharacterized protein n=1 Tax=Amphiura filiformis TaxID=82378 RepID=UPI003B213CD9
MAIKIVSLILCWIGTLTTSILAETRVVSTSPVNPVKYGGILSLHCQVWGIENGQEVTIFYQNGDQRKRLSLNDNVMDDEEEQRMFLATRQLDDGSLVYFLSIIMTKISDSGKYSCTIIDTKTEIPELVSTDSIYINVQYFPEEHFPTCHPDKQLQVEAGTTVSLNCSSELGYPAVSLTWTREGRTLSSTRQLSDNRVDAILNFKPRLGDDGAILLCTAQSTAFPDKQISCHVGPLIVYGEDSPYDTNTPFPNVNHVDSGAVLNMADDVEIPAKTPTRQNVASSSNCANSCTSLDTPVLRWIISTSVACATALLFLVIGIVLLIIMIL